MHYQHSDSKRKRRHARSQWADAEWQWPEDVLSGVPKDVVDSLLSWPDLDSLLRGADVPLSWPEWQWPDAEWQWQDVPLSWPEDVALGWPGDVVDSLSNWPDVPLGWSDPDPGWPAASWSWPEWR